MVNHPNRSRQEPAAALRRLITKHSLARIDAHVTRDVVILQAWPDAFHPLVAQRRDEAFIANETARTLDDAKKIHAALLGAVAQASGNTLDEAIGLLTIELERRA